MDRGRNEERVTGADGAIKRWYRNNWVALDNKLRSL